MTTRRTRRSGIGRHPYVGLAVFDDANGPSHRCSASLLSPTVVLTAGHCTDGTVAARVWVDEDVQTTANTPFSGGPPMTAFPTPTPTSASGAGTGCRASPSATSASSCSPSRSRPVWSASTPSSRRPAWSTSCPARHGHAGRLRGAGADRRRRPAGVGGAQGPTDGPGPADLGLVHPQRGVRPGDGEPRAGGRHLLRRFGRPDPERRLRHGTGGQLLCDRDVPGASPRRSGRGLRPAGQECAAGGCRP